MTSRYPNPHFKMKEPKELDYFRAWLLFFVASTGIGILLGIIIGSFVAGFMGAGGANLAQMTTVNRAVGFAIGLPVSYFTFRAVIGKYLFPKIEDDSPPAP
jgi:integral membrane sensor domain MASE1